ncbi:SRPBCC family protein [Methanolobus chelungpuianus]|uniref:ATPase n=1 Tax=Methanolobus chelungpuianus TaxID=502115 RepID=A0AAE3KWZ3_9EURY|nr:SRPBCC domain-containing protein [Methanolobus chelungpuianus]MCQ6961774.1 ATPase [Methanolobus chelungpuianus]
MHKLHFSIGINTSREKVWNTMLGRDTYRLWTDVFGPGSHYVGDWSKGSKMLFLGPEETGAMSGMVSRIKENRPYEYISIEHIGIVQDGKEDTTSESVKGWAGALENYTFKEVGSTTEVLVDVDTAEGEYEQMFQATWPEALQKLKQLAENA